MNNQIYESDSLVSDYLFFHYAEEEDFLPWAFGPCQALHFPSRTTAYAKKEQKKINNALDLGCSVGRSTFELSQFASHVLGVDFSHAFINAANSLANGETLNIKRENKEYALKRPTSSNADRIQFQQGDAMQLQQLVKENKLGKFDLIHASNLLCRLPNPAEFLKQLPAALKTGGTVILATPFSWLEEYTPSEHIPKGGSWEWLQEQMKDHFTLQQEADEPFLIQEHSRKYQWCVSKISVWQRKAS